MTEISVKQQDSGVTTLQPLPPPPTTLLSHSPGFYFQFPYPSFILTLHQPPTLQTSKNKPIPKYWFVFLSCIFPAELPEAKKGLYLQNFAASFLKLNPLLPEQKIKKTLLVPSIVEQWSLGKQEKL